MFWNEKISTIPKKVPYNLVNYPIQTNQDQKQQQGCGKWSSFCSLAYVRKIQNYLIPKIEILISVDSDLIDS